jgi:hypothetical protein
MTTTGSWPKTAWIILYNIVSIWRAYRTRPIYGTTDFLLNLKAWLTKVAPLFVKITKATPITWDDKISDAVQELLLDPVLFSTVETPLASGIPVPDEQTRVRLRERIRARIERRSNAAITDNEVDEQTESMAVAVMILSLIASSTNIWAFIQNLRKRINN